MSQVVIITGASAGVGRATARAFAQRGASLVLVARNEEALRNAAREVEALGGRAMTVVGDVSDPATHERAAEVAESELGAIDVWVNNAMASTVGPVKDTPAGEFRRVTEVTYLGYVNGTLAALKRMLPRDRGTIVQVGSSLAYRGIPLQAAYCGAKHAIQGFTESLRCELLHDESNVTVTVVNLPAVNTPQFRWTRSRMPKKHQPFGPIFQPEIAAEAIYWAAHHKRRELNVSAGTTKAIIANSFIPGILDHYLARVGYDGQQGEEPEEKGKRDNLFDFVPGDAGAHGAFDDRAIDRSPQLWSNTHRGAIALGVSALALLGIAAIARTR